jgi:tripartite-type tricarboxylate transporter receptor subunit TctC
MFNRRRFLASGASSAALFTASPSWSQSSDFPIRPLRIVVGYVAGGTNDILARLVAAELAPRLGQPVVVENRPGASAIIGAQAVAKAPPDGYTLLLGGTGPMAFNAALYSKLPYSPTKDFAPISMIGNFPLILVSGPGAPATFKDLVAFSKSNPEQVNYGSSSAAFRLPMEWLKMQTGAKMTHVAYKGTAEVLQAVITGQVAVALVDPGPASSLLKAGKLTGLAVTSTQRVPDFTEIPTLRESGVDMRVELWSALLAPAGTPVSVVSRLNGEISNIVRMPSVVDRMRKLMMTPESSTPQELSRTIESEVQLWTRVAVQNNIKAD